MTEISKGDILLVDDAPANLQVLMRILETRGYRTRPVTSGQLALELAIHSPPDLILLDITMPEMDGFTVCRRLKETPALREVPVIFLSAHTESDVKIRAFSEGGVDYVTKPFESNEVLARVATHLTLRARERDLRASLARQMELEKLRDSLVHMIVHDLRSPLSAMIGNLELLAEGFADWPRQAQDLLWEAIRASGNMVDQVNTVLEVSRLEAEAMPLHPQECDAVALARESVTRLKSLIAGKTVTLNGPDVLRVKADPDLLFRVFQNLVANALKFTPACGRVWVRLRAADSLLTVEVGDEGCGIPQERLGTLFQKFGTLPQARGSCLPSTGLGLYFCRLAVEAHGGTIGVRSDEGKGSTFWFSIPLVSTVPVPASAAVTIGETGTEALPRIADCDTTKGEPQSPTWSTGSPGRRLSMSKTG